ncbi:MAG: NAD(P)-dependent alcohol dehydrogenase [Bacteroidota bacterium]|nr:NAD(P)-dependent alcohol dehydrogenase [Bacteroidota bacterium]
MKAAFRSKYVPPGDLSIKELDIPTPKNDEVLIRVHASTVNRSDCHVLSGKPFVMRFFTGLLKPRASIIGTDFTGEIAAVGSSVKSFKAGDKIMGFSGAFGCGAHAQYFVLPETKANKMIVSLPANLNYDEAAACLEGAVYAAMQILGSKPQAGQKAMVYGASGAIGSAYIQFFKSYGVSVTAVCRMEQAALMRSLGAEKIIDYTKQDFTKDDERYDMIFDAVGKTSFVKCKKLMKKNGIFGSSNGMINFLWILVTPLFGGKKVVFHFSNKINEALEFIKGLIEKGKFVAVIDRKYPLDKIAEAFTYVGTGQKIGNVIITMDGI